MLISRDALLAAQVVSPFLEGSPGPDRKGDKVRTAELLLIPKS